MAKSSLKTSSDYALEELRKAKAQAWPRFQMKIVGPKHVEGERYLPLFEAAKLYDSGFVDCRIGEKALEESGTVRPMSKEEIRAISNLADEYSASK